MGGAFRSWRCYPAGGASVNRSCRWSLSSSGAPTFRNTQVRAAHLQATCLAACQHEGQQQEQGGAPMLHLRVP